MTDLRKVDLSACREWRVSTPLGDARLGIVPAWNAVTLLNPAAADIWDLLIATGDVEQGVARYARRRPDRAPMAHDDVAACLAAWTAQGLFEAPAPSSEQRDLARFADRAAPPMTIAGYRRTVAAGGVAVALEIADPALGRAIAGLLADFPDAPQGAAHLVQATGPEGGWLLWVDRTPARLARNFVEARGQIVSELVRLAGGGTPWLATVHGAMLAGPSGGIFLAGASGAGKSTLAAGLVARGWRLVAEDCAPFDAGMRVHPLPFALSLKDGAVAPLGDGYPGLESAPVHQLGARRVRYRGLPAHARASIPVRPDLVIDVEYRAEMDPDAPAELVPLSPVETLGLFLNEESYVDFAQDACETFLDFVATTPAVRIIYGSTASAAGAILHQLARDRAGAGRRAPLDRP